MAEIKTKKSTASVPKFIASVKNEKRRADAKVALKVMREATGMTPKLWGSSIVGYGSYHYKSGRSTQEGDWPLTGFSPRAQNMTFYVMPGFKDLGPLLKKLGPHKTSVGCLYITDLSKTHLPSLKAIIKKSVATMKKRYRI